MKRCEFVEIVNEVAAEEQIALQNEVTKIKESNDDNVLATIISEAISQIAEISARTTAKIIEKSGLVQFDD